MRTTTIRATPIRFASCAPESGQTVFTLAAVVGAYRACRRRKRATRNAQRYEMGLLDHVVDTAQALSGRFWRPSRAVAFVVRRPKAREILAADFADRVVHHLLVPRLERQFEPVFIHDCFSNRRGKGTHGAVDRLQTFMRPAHTQAVQQHMRLHYLQLDVANFFNSINRRCLFGLVRARFARDQRRPLADPRHLSQSDSDELLGLTRQLLTGNAATGAVLRGTPAEFALVPEHKRLINAPAETGLPIGNLTSQFFANVYLNELDQFVKHTLKCRYYVRYVDDMVLLDPDPAVLLRWRDQIEQFLFRQLGLRLRDAGLLQPVSNGVDFLGYVVRPDYRLVRQRVVAHLREKLDRYERQITGQRTPGARSAALSVGRQDYQFPADSRALFSMLASYLGHFKHASSQRLVASLWTRYPWLAWVVRRSANGHLLPTQSAPGVTSMRGQWRYFKKRFAPACVLMQVGNRVEMYGTDARRLAQWPNHGGSAVAKIGWAPAEAGLAWPMALVRGLLQRLTQAGLAWVYVDEQGWLKGGLKQRALRRLHWAPQLSPADLQAVNQSQHQQHQHSAMKAVHLGAKP